ncbi:MAG TPA: mannose-1-phosphate guanylyltransferase/mannose-6-phosphate isomerase [Azospirillaceae bacterium]|nr:mannose-1-phosphate guanylyltransferase/mannose-6-phosphate isomerase [Azospirillaceae bacterium]
MSDAVETVLEPAAAGAAPAPAILPVLLSGGAGSRLWPLSREKQPKQLLALCGERTMIQDTALRVLDPARFGRPLVICNADHRAAIEAQLAEAGIAPSRIALEPMGRNTAPAVAAAALLAMEAGGDPLLLVLPADHYIRDAEAFLAAVETAERAARSGALVTFGITPDSPETGYGYIRRGEALGGVPGAFRVAAFAEKPDRARAEAFLASGEYAWNSGMFLFPAGLLVAELERHAPDVLAAAREAVAKGRADGAVLALDAGAFARAPNISVDYAVMERTDRAAVVPAEMGWTDVGAWSALWDIADKDAGGNAALGDVMLHDSRGNLVRSEGRLTALVGVDDLVVVVTPDAVLVARKDRAQDVKEIVTRLKREGRTEATDNAGG